MQNLVFNDIKNFKTFINSTKDYDFSIDLSNQNFFESLKFIVMSSAYFYQKFPQDKLKFKIKSEDVKTIISSLEVKNLEFV